MLCHSQETLINCVFDWEVESKARTMCGSRTITAHEVRKRRQHGQVRPIGATNCTWRKRKKKIVTAVRKHARGVMKPYLDHTSWECFSAKIPDYALYAIYFPPIHPPLSSTPYSRWWCTYSATHRKKTTPPWRFQWPKPKFRIELHLRPTQFSSLNTLPTMIGPPISPNP